MMADIEDYALLSDARTAALVSRDGSIDWLCVPRFDSPSVFAAMLGDARHGRWQLRPTEADAASSRRYDGDTFVLVTRWETSTGVADVYDLMPMDHRHLDVVRRTDILRRVVGISGSVEFGQELTMRFDYARTTPWVRQVGSESEPALLATAGPDSLIVRGAALAAADHRHTGRFTVTAGSHIDASLTWFPSHHAAPGALRADSAIERTRSWWQNWADRVAPCHMYRAAVVRSLLVLRALTHHDTGGIVAAPTTSLPEWPGGSRNWDYRYVWLRDAALALEVLIDHGFLSVAHYWRQWLLRAVAGSPDELQIMYGIGGERVLTEQQLASLPGHGGAAPVRIGNGAFTQYQADVVGEVLVALHAAREAGLPETGPSWPLQRALLDQLVKDIDRPDHGLWEIRGVPRLFTHSRVMMWAALDRGIRAVHDYGLDGPCCDAWEAARDRLRTEIDERAVSSDGWFTQHEGTDEVDAALLMLPRVGYCPADDPRMLATVARIEETLIRDGLVLRYRTATGVDGIAEDENPFLACSFWLVHQYSDTGRLDEAHTLMDRLCALANDVGLLAEEYDPATGHHAGNMPQAFSHLTLVQAVDALENAKAAPAV